MAAAFIGAKDMVTKVRADREDFFLLAASAVMA